MRTSSFLVSVHDVHPVFGQQLEPIFAALQARIGHHYSLAITPQYHGHLSEPTDWTPLVAGDAELLLHGITHRRRRSLDPFSVYTGFADEWAGVPVDEMAACLRRGARLVHELTGRSPVGLTAPCWCWGPAADPQVWPAGIGFALGFRRVWDRQRLALDIATYNRDFGCLSRPLGPLLAPLGVGLGQRFGRRRGGGLECIVIHPNDVRRGQLAASLERIDRLLEQGARPTRLTELFAGAVAV